MKSKFKFAVQAIAGLIATGGVAYALPHNTVPEPSSLWLVGAAVGGAVAVSRFFKKK